MLRGTPVLLPMMIQVLPVLALLLPRMLLLLPPKDRKAARRGLGVRSGHLNYCHCCCYY